MKKSVINLLGGLFGVISLFLGFSTLGLKFSDAIPEAVREATKATAAEGGKLNITFFEYIGDFRNNAPSPTFWSILSAVFVVVSIICVSTLLVVGLIATIRNNKRISEAMMTKWVSVSAFIFLGVALAIGLIFPNYPPVENNAFEYTATIGLGSIIFLIATAACSVLNFTIKE